MKEIVGELGSKLPAHVERVGGTFSAVLPFVPTGPREVFSRPTPELYYEAQRLNPTDLLSEQPSRFLAVYLDDACVTGKSLLNFLIRASKARPDQGTGLYLVRLVERPEEFFLPLSLVGSAGRWAGISIESSIRASRNSPRPVVEMARAYSSSNSSGGSSTPRSYLEM